MNDVRIYIDTTPLVIANFLSGIQRVVRSVVSDLIAKHGDDIVLLYGNSRVDSFSVVPHEYFRRRFCEGEADVELENGEHDLLVRDMPGGSVFLELDGVWNGSKKRAALLPELKANGIKYVAYVYDVCPITYPQFSHQNTVFRFIEFIGTVIRYADAVIMSTNAAAETFRSVCEKVGRKCPPLYVSSLGCDFKPEYDIGNVDQDVVASLEGIKYILCVGTIEPRKNHALLLDAFKKRLFARGLSLVLVGREGWNVADLVETIYASCFFGRQLFHFKRRNDDTLAWIYAHAFATAMATHEEGFGLPVVESLVSGVPAILSDIPVMHEVGGDCALYFDNSSYDDFANVVEKLVDAPDEYRKLKEKAATFRGTTWKEVGDRIYNAVMDILPKPRKPLVDVRQLVLLTARFEDAQSLLPYIDKYEPFIEKVLLLCPDSLAARRGELDGGRLKLEFLSDSEILAGHPLPEDHAKRNLYLRCLAMKSPLIDDVFIMSDDDYRPMTTIHREVFVDEDTYKGYYSYDLRNWLGSSSAFTSFDKAVFAAVEFLQANGYPTKQYASHMPQIYEKAIFLDMLAEHPGIETEGYLDWDIYFNYLQAKHPDLLDVKPYVAMCWPGAPTDWPLYVKPPEYLFENHYSSLYGDGKIFGDIPDVLDDEYEANCRKKIARFDARSEQYIAWQQAFVEYKALYEKRHGLPPHFTVHIRDGVPKFTTPAWVAIPAGGFVHIPVRLDGDCTGLTLKYRLRDADGNVVFDIDKTPVQIVPEPPVLKMPVFTKPAMSTFELYAVVDGKEYSSVVPICPDKPLGALKNAADNAVMRAKGMNPNV